MKKKISVGIEEDEAFPVYSLLGKEEKASIYILLTQEEIDNIKRVTDEFNTIQNFLGKKYETESIKAMNRKYLKERSGK